MSSRFSQWVFILLASVLSISTFATVCFAAAENTSFHSAASEIQIYKNSSNENTVYRVNGKRFYWNDLSEFQKSRLEKAQSRLEMAESKLHINEEKLRRLTLNFEAKASALELVTRKLEMATVKLEEDILLPNELEKLAYQLEKLTEVNEQDIHRKEVEMLEIEQQIQAMDNQHLAEMEIHSKQLETVLLEIAEELE